MQDHKCSQLGLRSRWAVLVTVAVFGFPDRLYGRMALTVVVRGPVVRLGVGECIPHVRHIRTHTSRGTLSTTDSCPTVLVRSSTGMYDYRLC
ncbi:hypothetical protein RSAG8_00857, partial [Rhizoctonia solani AG-8 WAC10335]